MADDFGLYEPLLRREAAQRRSGGIPVAPSPPGGTTTPGTSSSAGGGTPASGGSSGSSSGGSSSSSSGGSSGGKKPAKPSKPNPVFGGGPDSKGSTGLGGGSSFTDINVGGKGDRAVSANRYLDQVSTIQQQVEAVKKALGGKFHRALQRRLRNVNRGMDEQDKILLEGYEQRVADLETTNDQNNASAAEGTFLNLTNAGRERANALTQAAMQGAGESDTLQSQLMSLRNWQQNQADVSRNAADTAQSISASLTDLNADTKTGRANIELQGQADREALFNDYYDQREAALVQLGNLYGQQAELYGYANEAKKSKKIRRQLKRVQQASGNAYMDATNMAGKAHKNPGVSDEVMAWGGVTDLGRKPKAPRTVLNSSSGDTEALRPEGASLRSWT